MTNKLMDIANEEINRRAFDRAFDWACESLSEELFSEGKYHLAGVANLLKHKDRVLTEEQQKQCTGAAEAELFDDRFKEAEASGELDELLDPENELYTRAYNREEAEYMFHVLAAGADEGNLDAHFEFLKPFGITRENIWIEEEEESLAE